MANSLFKVKQTFFDSKAVVGAVDRAERRVLSKFGAYVRRTARSSIRTRKRMSRPGEPPTNRTGMLKRFIFFGYDRMRASVVIGPMRLNSKRGDAPEALEHGGSSIVTAYRRKRVVRKRMNIRARPFMGPALAKEQPKLPDMWRDSIK
jgi:hypothetical protein